MNQPPRRIDQRSKRPPERGEVAFYLAAKTEWKVKISNYYQGIL